MPKAANKALRAAALKREVLAAPLVAAANLFFSGTAKLPPLMAKIFPKIRTNDNKSGMLGSSVETLIASKTQVVFGPAGMFFDENSKTQLAVVKIDKFAIIK